VSDGQKLVDRHQAAGRFFSANGVRSFVLERGDGPAVVCMHGLPESSFGYRKLLPELAARGLRAIAFDLPGTGLAERPRGFDYSWTGLGSFSTAAIDALGIDGFHLLVHDAGGPVGFEVAAAMPQRIASLTVLNTFVEPAEWKRPWYLKPFVARGVGEFAVRIAPSAVFKWLMLRVGVEDRAAISDADLDAHLELIRRDDGGRAMLRIVRQNVGPTLANIEKAELYKHVLRHRGYPVQIIWGDRDPTVPLVPYGEMARVNAGLKRIITLAAKHFPQEDHAAEIARHVATLARESERRSP
jgi:pimeloyl-ACP methyl ester carboxylesterase